MPRKTETCFVEAPAWPQEFEYEGEHVIVTGRWHFLVESVTYPGEFYAVDLEPVEDDVGACTCRSAVTRHECRHERIVRERFGV